MIGDVVVQNLIVKTLEGTYHGENNFKCLCDILKIDLYLVSHMVLNKA